MKYTLKTELLINTNKGEENMKDLTAGNLKEALWETLNRIKDENMPPCQGDAIGSQAREIIRTVNTQLRVVGQAKRQVPAEVIKFAEE